MATRDPAPGALDVVRRFVNTLDIESGSDAIATEQGLNAFLREQGLMSAEDGVALGDASRAREVREALRQMLFANHDDEPVDAEAVARLNDAAGDAALMLRFASDGSSRLLPQAGGLDGAVGRLLGIVFSSMAQGEWQRLKACKRETCRWAFYDHSKNHSSKWCSMAVCGNREKARAYRRRRRLSA